MSVRPLHIQSITKIKNIILKRVYLYLIHNRTDHSGDETDSSLSMHKNVKYYFALRDDKDKRLPWLLKGRAV